MRYTCREGLIFGISAKGSVSIIQKCGGIIKKPLKAVSGVKRITGYGRVVTHEGDEILDINSGYAFILKGGSIERVKASELKNNGPLDVISGGRQELSRIKRKGFRIYPSILIEGSKLAQEYEAQKSITKKRCTKKTKGELK